MILTFLAPATRCNQRCPNCYITEVADEPVDRFDLAPDDFARFLEQFLEAGVPVLSVKFQGYEVSLPSSWPYLESVFRSAQEHNVRRSFVTNGMLLHKWTSRIRALDVARITVSLDGSTPEVNDPLRGLEGAFAATCQSVQRFLGEAPEFRNRLAIGSTLRAEGNFESLKGMPTVLRRLGISRWVLGVDIGLVSGEVRPLQSTETVLPQMADLQTVAEEHGIEVFASDGYGSLPRNSKNKITIYQVSEPNFFYRIDPVGGVQIGRAMFQRWSETTVRRWDPTGANAVDTVSYWENAAAYGQLEG